MNNMNSSDPSQIFNATRTGIYASAGATAVCTSATVIVLAAGVSAAVFPFAVAAAVGALALGIFLLIDYCYKRKVGQKPSNPLIVLPEKAAALTEEKGIKDLEKFRGNANWHSYHVDEQILSKAERFLDDSEIMTIQKQKGELERIKRRAHNEYRMLQKTQEMQASLQEAYETNIARLVESLFKEAEEQFALCSRCVSERSLEDLKGKFALLENSKSKNSEVFFSNLTAYFKSQMAVFNKVLKTRREYNLRSKKTETPSTPSPLKRQNYEKMPQSVPTTSQEEESRLNKKRLLKLQKSSRQMKAKIDEEAKKIEGASSKENTPGKKLLRAAFSETHD